MARLVKPIDPNDPEQYPADLTIKCGSLEVEAHSHILCQDSCYFQVVCRGSFLEAQMQELRLPAEEEFLIRRLLCHRYTTGYTDEPYDDEKDPPPHITSPAYVNRLCLNAQMYSIADKYDIPSLKDKAVEKFDGATWETHTHENMNILTDANPVDDLLEAIPLIYNSTPDGDSGLRDRAVVVVIYGWKAFRDHPGLRNLVATAPEFSRRIAELFPDFLQVISRF